MLPQVAGLVVVDNGSSFDLAAALAGRPVSVLSLGDNFGVASGFNRGIEWAQRQGFELFLLLDQDSIPRPDMVSRLHNALAGRIAKGETVAAVGPATEDPTSGRRSGFARMGPFRFIYESGHGGGEVAADFLISSGSLIPVQALRAIGMMDERLFVDLVDTEWFLRGRAAGWRAYGVPSAVLLHGIGERTEAIRIAGRSVASLHVHDPLRHYYIFRNSMIISRRPYVPRRWVLNNLVQLLGMIIYFGARGPARLQHIRMMIHGLCHGWQGVEGQYQPSTRIKIM